MPLRRPAAGPMVEEAHHPGGGGAMRDQQRIPPRVAFYTRISTDEDHQKYSLGAQKERLEAFCKAQWDDDWRLHKVYRDTESGTHMNRPGLEEMLYDVTAQVSETLSLLPQRAPGSSPAPRTSAPRSAGPFSDSSVRPRNGPPLPNEPRGLPAPGLALFTGLRAGSPRVRMRVGLEMRVVEPHFARPRPEEALQHRGGAWFRRQDHQVARSRRVYRDVLAGAPPARCQRGARSAPP